MLAFFLTHALFVMIVVTFVFMSLVRLDVTVKSFTTVIIRCTGVACFTVICAGTEREEEWKSKQQFGLHGCLRRLKEPGTTSPMKECPGVATLHTSVLYCNSIAITFL